MCLTPLHTVCRFMVVSKPQTQLMAGHIAEQKLGYPLDDWVADQRDADKSWQTIATDLSNQTDGIVVVSWETLRRWYS